MRVGSHDRLRSHRLMKPVWILDGSALNRIAVRNLCGFEIYIGKRVENIASQINLRL